MEVAIKTNQSKDEEDKVKFLQEAAIMGQFRHPNVVKLYGVVTVGEPVSYLLKAFEIGTFESLPVMNIGDDCFGFTVKWRLAKLSH